MAKKKYTVKELRAMAKKRGLSGYSKLRKTELIEVLELGSAKSETASPVPEKVAESLPSAGRPAAASIPEPPGAGYGAPIQAPPPPTPEPLPEKYGRDFVALVAREPERLFAWWDISGNASRMAAEGMTEPRPVLRVEVVGEGLHDIEVGPAWNWYLHCTPGKSYQVAVGFKDSEGNFRQIARSRKIRAPRVGISDEIDEQWMLVDETARRLLEYMGGFPMPGSPGYREERELHKLLISSPNRK